MKGLDASFVPIGTDVLQREGELAHAVGAGLEQELRAGVQQHAGHEEGEGERGHGLRTRTRRGSSCSTCMGKPERLQFFECTGLHYSERVARTQPLRGEIVELRDAAGRARPSSPVSNSST